MVSLDVGDSMQILSPRLGGRSGTDSVQRLPADKSEKDGLKKNSKKKHLALNAFTSTPFKLKGETKHFPPANKEWTNSVYLYNKANFKALPVKDNQASKLIKSFFNLHMEKSIARSKRMRSLIRKSTTKKLFVSKPEIKQTNDKVILTVYTFDREKQFLFRKLYFRINKWERLTNQNNKLKSFSEKKKLQKINQKKKSFKLTNKVLNEKKKKSLKYTWVRLKKPKKIKNKVVVIIDEDGNKKIVKEMKLYKQKLNEKKKLFKEKSFSLYDQFRHLKQLSFKPVRSLNTSLTSKPFKTDNALIKVKKPLLNIGSKDKMLKEKWLKSAGFKHGYNKLLAFKSLKNKLLYFISKKKNKNFYYRIIRKKNFYPLRMEYRINPFFKDTPKVRSFKKLLEKRNLMFIKKRFKNISKKLPYFGFKHSNIVNFLKTSFSLKNRFKDAEKILIYFYIAHLLSLLGIKIVSFEETLKVSLKKIKKLSKEDYDILDKPLRKDNSVISKKDKNILIKKKVPFYVRRGQKYKIPFNFALNTLKLYSKKAEFSLNLKNNSFDKIIFFFLTYLKKVFLSFKGQPLKQKVISNFSLFSSKFFLNVFYKSLYLTENKKKLEKNLEKFNKNVLTINSFVKLALNQSKFGKFLLPLKSLISKIYNKKIEINLVNLKSPHLNTDIFTEAVAIKLKKRIGLLKVMRRSLQLVKLPFLFKKAAQQFKINRLDKLSFFKSLDLSFLKNNLTLKNIIGLNSSDSLQTMLKSLYPRSFTFNPLLVNLKHRLSLQSLKDRYNNKKFNKLSSILNQIKYKWVTGIRLEAAGRLTRRYTASRSVFKFRQKGSLQNTDYSSKLDFLKDSMSNVLMRNLIKSNAQQSFLEAKKRIGAFGLKTLMSSY